MWGRGGKALPSQLFQKLHFRDRVSALSVCVYFWLTTAEALRSVCVATTAMPNALDHREALRSFGVAGSAHPQVCRRALNPAAQAGCTLGAGAIASSFSELLPCSSRQSFWRVAPPPSDEQARGLRVSSVDKAGVSGYSGFYYLASKQAAQAPPPAAVQQAAPEHVVAPLPVSGGSSELVQGHDEVMEDGCQDMVKVSRGLMGRLRLKIEGQTQNMNKETAKSIAELGVEITMQ